MVNTYLRPLSREMPSTRARIGPERRHIDVVDIFQERIGIEPVLVHQPAQCGAVIEEILPPALRRLLTVEAEIIGDIGGHALGDMAEKAGIRRIERVVEIEDPSLDPGRIEPGGTGSENGHGRNVALGMPARKIGPKPPFWPPKPI